MFNFTRTAAPINPGVWAAKDFGGKRFVRVQEVNGAQITYSRMLPDGSTEDGRWTMAEPLFREQFEPVYSIQRPS